MPPPRPRPPGAGRLPGGPPKAGTSARATAAGAPPGRGANPPGRPPPGAGRPPAAGAPGRPPGAPPGAAAGDAGTTGAPPRAAWNGLLPPGRGRGPPGRAWNGLLPPGRGRGRGMSLGSGATGFFGASADFAGVAFAGAAESAFASAGAGASSAGLLRCRCRLRAPGLRLGLRCRGLGRGGLGRRLSGRRLARGRFLGRRRRRGEGLAGLAHDGGFEGRGRTLDVFAELVELGNEVFARNAELLRDLMNAGLCHNSPVSVRPRQGRTIVTAGYSFTGTHRMTMGFHPVRSMGGLRSAG